MNKKGFFITFEGTEGSGKTTQAALLVEHLTREGGDVISTREPGGTDFGRGLREILLTNGLQKISALAELFLYCADRAQHIQSLIGPALDEGKCVICDRFSDATIAYQGWGRGLDREEVKRICQTAGGGIIPDLTLLLDIDPQQGLARAIGRIKESNSREDRFEKESLDFHRRVRSGYLSLAKAHADRFCVISAEGSPQEVHRRVVEIINSRMQEER